MGQDGAGEGGSYRREYKNNEAVLILYNFNHPYHRHYFRICLVSGILLPAAIYEPPISLYLVSGGGRLF